MNHRFDQRIPFICHLLFEEQTRWCFPRENTFFSKCPLSQCNSSFNLHRRVLSNECWFSCKYRTLVVWFKMRHTNVPIAATGISEKKWNLTIDSVIVFQMPSTPMFLCIVIEMILQMCDCFQLVIHHFHLLMTAYFHSFIHFIIFIPLVYFRVFWPTERPNDTIALHI